MQSATNSTNGEQQQQQQSWAQGSGKQVSRFYTRTVAASEVMDVIPEGATRDDFNSRPIMKLHNDDYQHPQNKSPFSITHGAAAAGRSTDTGTLLKIRKVPLKIEPKVLLANERTFIAWLHLLVWLAGAALTILRYSHDPVDQLYGFLLLPIAIAFGIYALYKYHQRAHKIKQKDPGPYEDIHGPTILGIVIIISISSLFVLKLYFPS